MSKFEITVEDEENIVCKFSGETEIMFYLYSIDDDIKEKFSDIKHFEQTGEFHCNYGGNSSWSLVVDKNKIYFEYGMYTIDVPSSISVEISTDIGYDFVNAIYEKICEILN